MVSFIQRSFWLKKIEEAWERKSVIWLSGVRRSGKTCLVQSISNTEYFDCELPRVRQTMTDPEAFLESLAGKIVILDEVHRLSNPSELLKIAADHFPTVKIIATGSSTLAASRKFKDTLTGRKTQIWLTPMIQKDGSDFNHPSLKYRLLRGGLPPLFLANNIPEKDFQEWVDSYWAKDIEELFRLEMKHPFQRLFELITIQSGGIFEATKLARNCEISRTTVLNYMNVLESTFVAHMIRPFSSRKETEIVSAPKVYTFDTGFFCYYRGWNELRSTDMGILWEHFVLNEIQAQLQTRDIHYWRDKQGHEVDFVYVKRGHSPVAIECKWSTSDLDEKNIRAFRKIHPQGKNYVVSQNVNRDYRQKIDGNEIIFCNLNSLIEKLL